MKKNALVLVFLGAGMTHGLTGIAYADGGCPSNARQSAVEELHDGVSDACQRIERAAEGPFDCYVGFRTEDRTLREGWTLQFNLKLSRSTIAAYGLSPSTANQFKLSALHFETRRERGSCKLEKVTYLGERFRGREARNFFRGVGIQLGSSALGAALGLAAVEAGGAIIGGSIPDLSVLGIGTAVGGGIGLLPGIAGYGLAQDIDVFEDAHDNRLDAVALDHMNNCVDEASLLNAIQDPYLYCASTRNGPGMSEVRDLQDKLKDLGESSPRRLPGRLRRLFGDLVSERQLNQLASKIGASSELTVGEPVPVAAQLGVSTFEVTVSGYRRGDDQLQSVLKATLECDRRWSASSSAELRRGNLDVEVHHEDCRYTRVQVLN